MICRKTMKACPTPGMCSPHDGCPATEQVSSAWLAQLRSEYVAYGAQNAALKTENERLTSRVALLEKYEEECLRLVREAEAERDQLKAENERLRGLLAEKVVNSTMLTGLVPDDGGMTLGFEGGACGMLAQLFGDQFYESPAINYLELRFDSAKHPDIGRLVVTLQREEGKTPAELRGIAETQVSALAFLLQYLVANEHNHDENQSERHMVITDAESLLAHLSGAMEAHTLVPDCLLLKQQQSAGRLKHEKE
ncbi:hypothetical protein WG29040_23190 [Pseudomonas sp. PAMC 29040]|uniref:hypothetical protein n=1 Tax=Pseudomonas sp. PAMC 29040 TaxID=2498450 RepID=UPI000FB7BF2B|nr:hypothetical protein [Pseudomonas sp. PAMC 29040]RUT30847.1 hypothetical protein WG29040_23190 [Pseudomonas sp. PAMC 29040]